MLSTADCGPIHATKPGGDAGEQPLPRIALGAAAGAVFGILITRVLCIPIQRKQAGAATLPRPEKWPNQFAKPVPALTLVDHFLLSAGNLSVSHR